MDLSGLVQRPMTCCFEYHNEPKVPNAANLLSCELLLTYQQDFLKLQLPMVHHNTLGCQSNSSYVIKSINDC